MNPYKILSIKEINSLLKFTAYMSILAAFHELTLDENEKKSAIAYLHSQTTECDPILIEFFKEADKVFENNLLQLEKDLPKGKKKREPVILKELHILQKIVLKLGNDYASAMNRSMNALKDHVSQAHYNVLTDFVVPLNVLGLKD